MFRAYSIQHPDTVKPMILEDGLDCSVELAAAIIEQIELQMSKDELDSVDGPMKASKELNSKYARDGSSMPEIPKPSKGAEIPKPPKGSHA